MTRFYAAPIEVWPAAELTPAHRRRHAAFSADWRNTERLLSREITQLSVTNATAVLRLAVGPGQITQAGWIYANARPDHPGVVLQLTHSTTGPLQFHTDRFTRWQDNARAIALGMEALRKMERYGIGTGMDQYRGFEMPMLDPPLDAIEADSIFLGRCAGLSHSEACCLPPHTDWAALWRDAAKRLHPDKGGDQDVFRRAREAYERLSYQT